MLITLAFRHLLVRKLRSLVLLAGFSLGVGVMIVLLSVGEAMLEQSRDTALVGGGEVTVLPLGIDVEAMRTGGLSGMFFGIDRARFLARQILGGPRHRDLVRVVSPAIEGKLLYLHHAGRNLAVRAGADLPSRARAIGSGLKVTAGQWTDSQADSVYLRPTAQQLYDEIDRFHLPPHPDPAWGEWHYFNLVTAPDEWWYMSYLVAGEFPLGRWGGQLLVTHRRPDGNYERFSEQIAPDRIAVDTVHAGLSLGRSFVRQRKGLYHLRGLARAGSRSLAFEVELLPAPNRYFPPIELGDAGFISGYVVPGLVARASGRICVAAQCRSFVDVPAYHDHNWGVWRDVTWEWGAAQGTRLNILYGGVHGPVRQSPFFLTAVDSLGVRQVLRFDGIHYEGSRIASGSGRAHSPARFNVLATRESDSLRLEVKVEDALGTQMSSGGFHRVFLQMRGHFAVRGKLLGQAVADSGMGFFETYVAPR